jgi:hypothetical protein
LSLPSFSLANCQTAVYFPNYIRTRLRVGYRTSGPTTTGATTDLFWRQAPKHFLESTRTAYAALVQSPHGIFFYFFCEKRDSYGIGISETLTTNKIDPSSTLKRTRHLPTNKMT